MPPAALEPRGRVRSAGLYVRKCAVRVSLAREQLFWHIILERTHPINHIATNVSYEPSPRTSRNIHALKAPQSDNPRAPSRCAYSTLGASEPRSSAPHAAARATARARTAIESAARSGRPPRGPTLLIPLSISHRLNV